MEAQSYLEKVGMEFKVERTRQRLTIKKLAELAKLAPKTIIVLENAQEVCGLTTLKKVADALGKPLKDFM